MKKFFGLPARYRDLLIPHAVCGLTPKNQNRYPVATRPQVEEFVGARAFQRVHTVVAGVAGRRSRCPGCPAPSRLQRIAPPCALSATKGTAGPYATERRFGE